MTSSAHCVPHDLLYRAASKILFMELLSWRITDFAWEIEFEEASQDLGWGVFVFPSEFCYQRQSVPTFWSFRLR
jgi:hypothetical protein